MLNIIEISTNNFFFLFFHSLGSTTEERDIRKSYLGGKGCLNYMFESVPFMTVEDEPRIIEIVKGKHKHFIHFDSITAQ